MYVLLHCRKIQACISRKKIHQSRTDNFCTGQSLSRTSDCSYPHFHYRSIFYTTRQSQAGSHNEIGRISHNDLQHSQANNCNQTHLHSHYKSNLEQSCFHLCQDTHTFYMLLLLLDCHNNPIYILI